jgi:hypothetical protein
VTRRGCRGELTRADEGAGMTIREGATLQLGLGVAVAVLNQAWGLCRAFAHLTCEPGDGLGRKCQQALSAPAPPVGFLFSVDAMLL